MDKNVELEQNNSQKIAQYAKQFIEKKAEAIGEVLESVTFKKQESQQEEALEKILQEKLQHTEDLQEALFEFDNVILKGYLDNLNEYELVPLETSLQEVFDYIRLKKITRIVYDKEEDNLDKFNNVFSALHSCNTSLIVILKGSEKFTDVYIGTSKHDTTRGYSAEATLEASLKGSFPGVEFEDILSDEIENILKSINSEDNNFITNVTGVPSLKSDEKQNKFIQGLEKIIEGMQNKNYTAVIQGSPVARQDLEVMEGAYQNIYSALSSFEQTQLTLSENESMSLGKSLTKGLTKTLTESMSSTQTSGNSRSDWDMKRALSSTISGAIGGAIGAGSVSGGLGVLPGGGIGAVLGLGTGLFGGSKNESISSTQNKSKSESESNTSTDSSTSTKGTSNSVQITKKNRSVQSLLEVIDEQLKRIQECKNYGMWSWGAYFISENEIESKLGADLYSGILRGEQTGLERSNITLWDSGYGKVDKFNEILNYISQLKHPVFKTPEGFKASTFLTPTSLISTREVTVAMSLPQKSLPGIPVFESVEFGRAVTTYRGNEPKNRIRIGSIFNLGSVDKYLDVNLDIDSLTAHTFVTGSTGSGKSNSIYLILNKLYEENKIPFLIIEPAKGEYKYVFGGVDGVNVFGTNPNLMSLLKINPFAFPNQIHVIEHIDRLIEILNAVWPMYAAMPAILKEAIELTYEKLGWDLLNSKNKYESEIYPDFQDLLDVLPEVIEKSKYSEEIKGNYAGALLTRIRSLTNGYFKTIFQKEELPLDELFDTPCIVDLSRVGSSETKSLLMGMVFLKLQEYRMSKASSDSANSGLKHITVLEEAHNLLRRTSSEQSQEGSNLQGKSVEMISNAIAEMRTYGEGFIIADQAPGLLDESVIRNTNTKIILRLPGWDDRNLVGKAENLKDEQIEELARLRTGCAAVYQNDWQEAVLCQFSFFPKNKHKKYIFDSSLNLLVDKRKVCKTELIKILLLAKLANQEPRELIKEKAIDLSIIKVYYPEILKYISLATIDSDIYDILNLTKRLDNVVKTDNIDKWTINLFTEVTKEIIDSALGEKLEIELIKTLLDSIMNEEQNNKEIFKRQKEKIDNNWRFKQ